MAVQIKTNEKKENGVAPYFFMKNYGKTKKRIRNKSTK